MGREGNNGRCHLPLRVPSPFAFSIVGLPNLEPQERAAAPVRCRLVFADKALFCTRGNERLHPWGRRLVMAKSRTKPEQIVTLLRQIEVAIANGKSTAQACKEAAVTEQTYYRWRKEYGGLKLDQARRLKELEKENARLKRVVADLALEKQVLRDVAQGNF